MTEDQLRLAAEFPAVTRREWEEAAEASLHGRKLAALESEDLDGIRSQIIYFASQDSGAAANCGRPEATRQLARRQFVHDAQDVADAVAADIEAIIAAPALVVELELAAAPAIFLPTGECTVDEIRAQLSLVANESETGMGGLGIDPLGQHLLSPTLNLSDVPVLVAEATSTCPGLISLSVSSAAIHLGGASDAQELGMLLASSTSYLRVLEQHGIGPGVAASRMEWSLQLDPNFFRSVTKLRAARNLVDALFTACGVQCRVGIHATTAERTFTLAEPSVNLLRSSSAVAAALVGGANSISVLPSDTRSPGRDAMAARMARNIPLVLFEEAKLARVADPAGGSWYFEQHTTLLEKRAWDFFQLIESQGGMPAVLADGWLHEKIAETADIRRQLIADRSVPLTGVSEFPLIGDELITELTPPRVSGFDSHYLDEDFTRLRQAADGRANDAGPLCVDVVCLGSQAEYSERFSWLSNLLAAGGIMAEPVGVESLGSGAVVVICGSDESYVQHGMQVLGEVRERGASRVIAVGRRSLIDGLEFDEVIGPNLDAVAFLDRLHRLLGVGQ
ncbi:MAG: methylmalonyl-CoA mutase family protein [Acidimicrobiales bacterium]